MIIYFTDRKLKILGLASTNLPNGLRIFDDLTTEEIDSGVNTFSCSIDCNDQPRSIVEDAVQEGHFILKASGDAFEEVENTYDSLYQIIETEFDNETETMYLYAEDAGLELLNKVVPKATLTNYTLSQMLSYFVPSDWHIKLYNTPTGTKTYTWDGENTCTERIKSIVDLWDCEVYYSFDIERLTVSAKNINVIKRRGAQVAKPQLRMNYDINKIVTKKSIANMATALSVEGGTPDNSDNPINLKGYSYSYTDSNGDVYQVDTTTGQMRNKTQMAYWSNSLDADGLICKSFSYDTTDKATLAGQARAALQKICYPEVNYEISVINLPQGTKIGDRLNIIDDAGELYLDSRILKLETSVANGTIIATFGEFLIKENGISEIVQQLASDFSAKVKNGLDSIKISIISSGGNIFHNVPIMTNLVASVFVGKDAIGNQTKLEEVFGVGAQLRWYDLEDTLLGTGFSYMLSTQETEASVVCRLYTEE